VGRHAKEPGADRNGFRLLPRLRFVQYDDEIDSMPSYFTYAEAERLVSVVRGLIEQLQSLQIARAETEVELNDILRDVVMKGGTIPPRHRLAELKLKHKRLLEQMQSVLERIQGIGCEVKDLEKGLVDFPTLYRGEVVYLCWMLGEDHIAFWHRVQDGFRGRRPIDDEFLAHHRGQDTD
jgi:hypothetical protein